MPRADWGIDESVIDDFDRSAQFTPYTGPTPPVPATYCFTVSSLKMAPAANSKHPQLRIGLTLEPRNQTEAKYAGYWIMKFAVVAPPNSGSKGTAFQYVPFLDALGVTSKDFVRRTILDEQGNVRKIGSWVNGGDTLVLCQIKMGADQNGSPRVEADWIGSAADVEFEEYDSELPDDEPDLDDDEYFDEDEDE